MTESGLLVSFEGISGAGKTYLSRAIRASAPGSTMRFVNELSERSGTGLDRKIIDVLQYTGDRFCRTGAPLSETFLLLALKMADYEMYIAPALAEGRTVIEDRSIDTVAVYQSILIEPSNPSQWLNLAKRIFAAASQWRRPPDLTFFLDDSLDSCIMRAESRLQIAYSEDERALLRDAADLYRRYAKVYRERIILLDRQSHSETEILARVSAEIRLWQEKRLS
jgi:dTMP kinase